VGKIDPFTLSRGSFDDVEMEPTVAQGGHHEPAPFIRRIGLIVAPGTEGHEVLEVEVRAALRAFHHVVDVEPTPHPARPKRRRQRRIYTRWVRFVKFQLSVM